MANNFIAEDAFSVIFFFWFVFDTTIRETNINLWECDALEQTFSDVNPVAHYFNLVFKFLFFTGLIVTGVFIFRGVEKESPKILKFSIIAFVILQVVGVYLFSVFLSVQWNAEPEDPNAVLVENIGTTPPAEELFPDDDTEKSIHEILNNVTLADSENILAAPDSNNANTTTTTPIPFLKVDDSVTTATPVTTIKTIFIYPVLPPPLRKLPHNQLVRLLFQMCFEFINGLVAVVYMIVLGLYMYKL